MIENCPNYTIYYEWSKEQTFDAVKGLDHAELDCSRNSYNNKVEMANWLKEFGYKATISSDREKITADKCDYLTKEQAFNQIISEITEKFSYCDICEWEENYDCEENNISSYRAVGSINDIIDIIKKYMEITDD